MPAVGLWENMKLGPRFLEGRQERWCETHPALCRVQVLHALQASIGPSASSALGYWALVYWVLKTPLWTGPKRSVGKGWESEQVRKPMSTSCRSWDVVYRDSQVRGVQWAWTISLRGLYVSWGQKTRPASILLSRQWKLQRHDSPRQMYWRVQGPEGDSTGLEDREPGESGWHRSRQIRGQVSGLYIPWKRRGFYSQCKEEEPLENSEPQKWL